MEKLEDKVARLEDRVSWLEADINRFRDRIEVWWRQYIRRRLEEGDRD